MSPSSLIQSVEAILFVSTRPLAIKKIQQLTGAKKEEVECALQELARAYEERGSGLRVQRNDDQTQIVTAPEATELARNFFKEEITSDLTVPQLETLTVLAYRGPLTKAELEHIRGVNPSLIIRNLLLRGLIEEGEPSASGVRYSVSFDFLRHLGIVRREDLPQFEALAHHELIDSLLSHDHDGEAE